MNSVGYQSTISPSAYELQLRGILVSTTFETVIRTEYYSPLYSPDYEGQEEIIAPDTKVYCLRVLQRGERGQRPRIYFFSLLLLCVDEAEGIYQRIGLLGPRLREDMNGVSKMAPLWWEPYKEWKPVETLVRLI